MKILKASVLIILVSINVVYAQESEKNIDLGKIKAPGSPAATIIDNQVGTINRPKSWSALEANFFSNYLGDKNNFIIPDNYAIEFSPFWAQNNLHLSNKEFLTPNVAQSFIQNLSVSVSSTQNYLLKDSVKSNAIGFGIRTMLWQGSKTEKDRIINKYNTILQDLGTSNKLFKIAEELDCNNCNREKYIQKFLEIIEEQKAEIFNAKLSKISVERIIRELHNYLLKNCPDLNNDQTGNAEIVSDLIDDFLQIETSIKDIEILKSERKGFKLEIAGAAAVDFPTNELDFSLVPKIGFWITPSYQPFKNDRIEFLGVFRYYNYNLDFYKKYYDNTGFFNHSYDYGLKLVLKWKKYSLEFEGVGRSAQVLISESTDTEGIITKRLKNDSDSQYLLNFNYQVNENIILTYNFGKKFMAVLNKKENLVSLLTVNFALNKPKSEILK